MLRLLLEIKTFLYVKFILIKAQPDNMELLDACLEKKMRLIDNEKMVNDKGQRIVVAFVQNFKNLINNINGKGLSCQLSRFKIERGV